MTDILQPLSAVILVLVLLGGALWLLRRRGMASSRFGRPDAGTLQLKVMERVPIGPQHALHLVPVGDRVVLVATAPGSCQMLDPAVREETGP